MSGSRTTLGPEVTKRALVAGVMLSAILMPLPAAAQQRVERLERLEVSLWPEYDQPSMLVILKGRLPTDTTMPASVRLPMPAQAGVPNAVAYRGPDGKMLMAQHSFEDEGDWVYVDLTTRSTEVRLEYYVALDASQNDRYYRFLWPSGLEIGQVAYDVLQPGGSGDLRVVPAGAKIALPNGLTEERGDLGAVLRGEDFTIEVSYSKRTKDLTVGPPRPAQPAAAPPSTLPARSDNDPRSDSWLPLFLVATVALVAGYWLGQRRRRT